MKDSEVKIVINSVGVGNVCDDIEKLNKKLSALGTVVKSLEKIKDLANFIDGLSKSIVSLNTNLHPEKYISFNEELYKTGLLAGKTSATIKEYSDSIKRLSEETNLSTINLTKMLGQLQLTSGFAKMSGLELEGVIKRLAAAGKGQAETNQIMGTLSKFSSSPELIAKLNSGDSGAFGYAKQTLLRGGDQEGVNDLNKLQASFGGSSKDMTDRTMLEKKQKYDKEAENRQLSVAEAGAKFSKGAYDFGSWLEKFLNKYSDLVAGGMEVGAMGGMLQSGMGAASDALQGFLTRKAISGAAAGAAGDAAKAGIGSLGELGGMIGPEGVVSLLGNPVVITALAAAAGTAAVAYWGSGLAGANKEVAKSKEGLQNMNDSAKDRGLVQDPDDPDHWMTPSGAARKAKGGYVYGKTAEGGTAEGGTGNVEAGNIQDISALQNKVKWARLDQDIIVKNAEIAKSTGASDREVQQYKKAEIPLLQEKLRLVNQELALTEKNRSADPAAYSAAITAQKEITKAIVEKNREATKFEMTLRETQILELNPVRQSIVKLTTGSMTDQLNIQQEMIDNETNMIQEKQRSIAAMKAQGLTGKVLVDAEKDLLTSTERRAQLQMDVATKYRTTGGQDTTKFQWAKEALSAVSEIQTTLPTALGSLLETRKGLYSMALAERDTAYEGYQMSIKNGDSEAVIQQKKMDYLSKSNTAAQEFMKMTGGLTDQIQSALGELNEMTGGFDETAPKLAEAGAMVKSQLGELYAPQFKYGSFGGESQDIMNTKTSAFMTKRDPLGIGAMGAGGVNKEPIQVIVKNASDIQTQVNIR